MDGGRVAAFVALLGLAGLAVLAGAAQSPPAPLPADAPAAEFSAERAFLHVERIAQRPHVTGSAANDEVRTQLIATLAGLGARPQVHHGVGVTGELRGSLGVAPVRNVVALLPGSAPTGRVFLVAHYDSVQVGPGASDDGAGVAAVLEVVRALATGPALRNDVVVLLTDAEEACLCGAEAFVAQHPLAADGGVVLNLEARGTGGPPVMFETSPANARLAAVFAAAAPHPVATSVAVEVYRRLPNDTDLTPFLAAGFAGLNSAYVDGSAAYHTPQDTPQRMDRGSLQAHGDNALALTRALGATDLAPLAAPAGSDATYFPVLGALARLPGLLVWPLAVAAAAAVALMGWRVRARLLGGAALALVPLVAAPLLVTALWEVLVTLRPGYAGMSDPWRPGPYRAAVLALVAAVVLIWYPAARRWAGAPALAFGGLAWLAVLGLALAAFAPGGSYLGALPALAGAVAAVAGLAVAGPRRPGVRIALSAGGAAVAVLVLAPTVLLFLPALGLAGAPAPAALAALLALTMLPVLDPLLPAPAPGRSRGIAAFLRYHRSRATTPRFGAGAAAAAAVLVLVGVGLAVDRFDAAHPVPTHLVYALDTDTGRARWLSAETEPVPWTSRFVADREVVDEAFPVLRGELATGPAQAAPLPAPAVSATAGRGGGRVVELVLRPQRAVRLLALRVDGPRVLRAVVAGREVPTTAEGPFGVVVHAPPADGVRVTLELAEGAGSLWVADGSDGLTALPGFVARPPEVGVAGSHTSELLLVSRTVALEP